jgi:hypothetical protein
MIRSVKVKGSNPRQNTSKFRRRICDLRLKAVYSLAEDKKGIKSIVVKDRYQVRSIIIISYGRLKQKVNGVAECFEVKSCVLMYCVYRRLRNRENTD